MLILTRLITEDFVKMRSLMFFRFVYVLADKNEDISSFCRSCLFDVLLKKHPKLIVQNFIDSLFYFNDQIDPAQIYESEEYKNKFKLKDKKTRRQVFSLLISHMEDVNLYETIVNICSKILQKFIDESLKLDKASGLLSDAFYVMVKIEDQMESAKITELTSDNPNEQILIETTKKLLERFHNDLIEKVLPTLNAINRFLRHNNSPLQSELRVLFRRRCEKNPSLINDLKNKEPILAAEIEYDLASNKTPIQEESSEASPQAGEQQQMPFRSPLLSRIIQTPRMTLVQTSANASPMSVAPHRSMLDPMQKRAVIPFNLDEDDD